jgi:S1/P1 Nuclease.
MKHSILLLLFLTCASARAWDPIGHMIVTQIAWDHLEPSAKEKIEAGMKAFNSSEKADYTFVMVGPWLDDVRARTRDYNTWHYVNLPFTPDGLPLPDESAGPNVVWGADLALGVLAGEKSHDLAPPTHAVAILAHLVGDMHQPLHTTNRNEDAGGNRVLVSNLEDPESDLIFTRGGNLHFFWDSAYRRVFQDGKAGVLYANALYPRNKPLVGHKAALELVRKDADAIQKEFPPSLLESPLGNPEAWALESHAIGYDFGYGRLPEITDETPIALDEAYVTEARSIARKRLALAGYRLAALLNALYAD